ncbi:hypothetical protein GIB67_022147 [Kingdonia uniflora]|uniref:RING-type domain-containing protein n=1 Tax=Kingdonia uniflora TaxID=39325 RepID=A0A7J7N984_9MAGN|nr:hypothetical protein GIB67_022147 [Kingdonia uniflora]
MDIVCLIASSCHCKTISSFPAMGNDNNPNEFTLPRTLVLLTGIALAALVITLYHCATNGWCSQRPLHDSEQQDELEEGTPSVRLESLLQFIPAYRYDKEKGLIGEDGICTVCLSEFVEGEVLRTLPECVHSFHVPCIDMWLNSHTSCPLCRTDAATPSPMHRRPLPSP